MSSDQFDDKAVLRDPKMLAQLERNLRGAGMNRRNFLTLASAALGTAILAACGDEAAPTATTAARPATTAPTTAASAATTAPTTAAGAASAAMPTRAASAVTGATTAPSAVAPTAASTTAATAASTTAATAASTTAATTAATAAATTAAAASPAAMGAVALTPPLPAATMPESNRVFVESTITSEPVDNDFNRDLYSGGISIHQIGLLRYDQDFNLVGELAESYSNVGPVFTFKLRQGLTWSDGMPITAKDVVYSLKRQVDPRTGKRLRLLLERRHQGCLGYLRCQERTTRCCKRRLTRSASKP